MTESDDAIRKAESFLEEKELDKPLTVELSMEIGKDLHGWLATENVIDLAVERVINRHGGLPKGRKFSGADGLPLDHPDRLLPQLINRFANSIQSFENSPLIKLDLSAAELDFINARLKKDKSKDSEYDGTPAAFVEQSKHLKSESDEVEEFWKKITFEANTSLMADFLELNLAFIRAGGEPRKIFLNFYDGPLPLQTRGESETSSE